ncbi:MAG: prepilin-type N-terminal cleavage/methylation domain-containing protein [Verrucomicrobiota bacterium]
MNDKNPSLQTNRNGFTLIEVLVTMAISSVLLIVLAVIIAQTTDGYAVSQRSVNHLSQSRAFFQLFQSELSLRLPETPLIHLSSSVTAPESSQKIAFVRTLANDEQLPDAPGDLATSCYYVAFVEDSEQRIIPKLFRKILSPGETQSLIEAGDETDFPDINPSLDEPVIDFVLSFQATPMYFNPATGNDEAWDKTIEHAPSHIELTLRTIDESFARRLPNQAAWHRLAISPKKNELQMIRSVSHNISLRN